MIQWRLGAKFQRRFQQGHPWVYSNELQASPKGVEPGQVVELTDAGGKFLAFGIANPNSLISFRTLSRNPAQRSWFDSQISKEFFFEVFQKALRFRLDWFGPSQSFRWVYGEVDECPGLVIDRYIGKETAVIVVQPHSAGMDRALPQVLEALQGVHQAEFPGTRALVVVRRDAGSRLKEGLEKLPPECFDLQILKPFETPDVLREFRLMVSGVMGSMVSMQADLWGGQKTGFFLDQLQNIKLVEGLLLRKLRHGSLRSQKPLRILDLCSYVGQWSVHLAQTCIERQALPIELTLVDASDSALKIAHQNVRALSQELGAPDSVAIQTVKADVLEPIPALDGRQYAVVIADPPALIKSRKHIPQGQHAYVQLMTLAIQKTLPGGILVACSCSQLLSPDDFKMVLEKATRRSGRKVRWIAQGGPSVDHFQQFAFLEGHYLKCWVAQVD